MCLSKLSFKKRKTGTDVFEIPDNVLGTSVSVGVSIDTESCLQQECCKQYKRL